MQSFHALSSWNQGAACSPNPSYWCIHQPPISPSQCPEFWPQFYWIDLLLFLVAKSCLTLCDRMDCSRPGFLVLHYLPGFPHTHVHWVKYIWFIKSLAMRLNSVSCLSPLWRLGYFIDQLSKYVVGPSGDWSYNWAEPCGVPGHGSLSVSPISCLGFFSGSAVKNMSAM